MSSAADNQNEKQNKHDGFSQELKEILTDY